MKSICYMSTVNSLQYPDNKNSKFTCQLSENWLTYIPNVHRRFQHKDSCVLTEGNLAIAVKSISFPSIKHGILIKQDNQDSNVTDSPAYKATVFGLRSTITSEFLTFNNRCDKIIATFVIQDWNRDVCIVEIENPVFHASSFQLLCNPSFELVELVSNSTLSGIDNTSHIPTICEILVSDTQPFHNRMLPPFNLLLVSNDEKSKKLCSSNNSMEFTVHLSDRKELSADSAWSVVLKSLQMSSKIYNIQSSNFFFSYYEYPQAASTNPTGIGSDKMTSINMEEQFLTHPPVIHELVQVKFGYYPTIRSFCNQLNKQFSQLSIPLHVKPYGKKIKFVPEWEVGRIENRTYSLVCSPYLANLLGLSKSPTKFAPLDLVQMKTGCGEDSNVDPCVPAYHVNLSYGKPKNLVVHCSIVSKIAVGAKMIRLLKFIHLSDKEEQQASSDVISFNFNHNTFAQLDTHYFHSISITMTDLSGTVILAEHENIHPTVLHLMFTNHNN